MFGLVIYLFAALVAIILAGLAAGSDWKGYKIPNRYCLMIAGAFVANAGLLTLLGQYSNGLQPVMSHLVAFIIVFVITFIMYSAKVFGAGDSKLASAMALWVGLHGLPAFLFYTTCAGGVLALAAIALRRAKTLPAPLSHGWVMELRDGRQDVPYGIALAAGFAAALIYVGYFSPSTLQSFVLPQ
jgi:prepilin peptidase CpaA